MQDRGWFGLALVLAAVLAAYVFDVGHGFIKDDFAWIGGSLSAGPFGWLEFFTRRTDFYRPIVNLSFLIDWQLFGTNPLGYGATNLLLALGGVAAVFALARALGLGTPACVVAAALWGLNPHGVGGSIMWISGRTSSLATLFSVLTALCVAKRHLWLAAAAFSLAVFAKEEVVCLPIVLAAASYLLDRGCPADERARRVRAIVVHLSLVLVVYAVARFSSSAFVPWTAPPYYRFTTSPIHVLRNVLEYADRVGTLSLVAFLLSVVVLGWSSTARERRRYVAAGAAWCIGGFVPTLLLPVRSSLYVLLPSVGVAIAAAAVIDRLWTATSAGRRRLAIGMAAVALMGLVPLLHSRNARLRNEAELSSRVLDQLEPLRAQLASGRVLILNDDLADRVNLAAAFGTLAADAVRLRLALPEAAVWVDPPSPGWELAGLSRPASDRPSLTCRLVERRLEDCRTVN